MHRNHVNIHWIIVSTREYYVSMSQILNIHLKRLFMLFAGDTISDQGKYKNVAQICHSPLIVTCNVSRFSKDKKCWTVCFITGGSLVIG